MNKNILNNFIIIIVSISLVMNLNSCKKELITNSNEPEYIVLQTKSWWQLITGIAAAVVVFIECTEGQYYEKHYYDANGRPVVEKGCRGLGHC